MIALQWGMRLIIYGNPAPQGSKRFVGVNKAGRGVIIDANPRTRTWRADVIDAVDRYIENHGSTFEQFTCAVQVHMVFSLLRPKTVTRKKRPHPSAAPDLGKLARSTEDALTAARVWADDALVVEYTRLAKVYCDEDPDSLPRPGCLVLIAPAPVSIELGPRRALLQLEAS